MNITVLRNDQAVYTREQAFGGNQLTQDIARQYGMGFDEAEAGKRSGSLPENYESELLRPFMDGLALEISRALQFFFTSTQFNQVDQIVLAGGCAGSNPWAAPGRRGVTPAARTRVRERAGT